VRYPGFRPDFAQRTWNLGTVGFRLLGMLCADAVDRGNIADSMAAFKQ